MKTERELFLESVADKNWIDSNSIKNDYKFLDGKFIALKKDDEDYADWLNVGWEMWEASASREGYKLMPCNPTEEMWGGTARQLVKYMQMKDRYCPASLKKHFDRFIGEIPDWLNEEVQDWTSEHAFATADLGVFIYKAMYHEFKN